MSETKAARPGMWGRMVVSLQIMVVPEGLRPTYAATIIFPCLSWGHSSITTEFTLSGSILACLPDIGPKWKKVKHSVESGFLKPIYKSNCTLQSMSKTVFWIKLQPVIHVWNAMVASLVHTSCVQYLWDCWRRVQTGYWGQLMSPVESKERAQ